MVSSRFVLSFLATLLALIITGSSYAQAPLQTLGIDIINAPTLSASQKKQVEDFTSYWCSQLTAANTTTGQAEAARKKLLEPLNSASPVFRLEYSGQILPKITPLITGNGSPHSASNAFLIVGGLASRRSIDLLIHHSDSRHEDRLYIRILASQNCEKTLVYFSNALKSREIASAVRGLRNAAQREDNPIVLGHQLAGIQAIQTPEALDALVQALEKVVEKIQAPHEGMNPFIKPFSETVKEMRQDFLNLPKSEKERLSRKLSLVLGSYFSAAMNNWDAAHADSMYTRQYSSPLRLCESLMFMLEFRSSTPNTDLQNHWDQGEKARFTEDVRKWNGVLGR